MPHAPIWPRSAYLSSQTIFSPPIDRFVEKRKVEGLGKPKPKEAIQGRRA
jgi:hypothetical protein